MKYIITEEQLSTILGDYKPSDFLYYKNLAKPFGTKKKFMSAYPKEYYLAKKAGVLDSLKDWDKRGIENLIKYKGYDDEL